MNKNEGRPSLSLSSVHCGESRHFWAAQADKVGSGGIAWGLRAFWRRTHSNGSRNRMGDTGENLGLGTKL